MNGKVKDQVDRVKKERERQIEMGRDAEEVMFGARPVGKLLG